MSGQSPERENVSLRAEVAKLREWDAASREILAAIKQNRGDERPVLDAITRNAVVLCDASGAGLWLLNSAGTVMRLASISRQKDLEGPRIVSVGLEFPREDISPMGQCYRESRTMNVADNQEEPYYKDGDPAAKKLVDKVGMRSRLIVPLLENGTAFGCISLHRKEVQVFSDEEIALIESFAEQAVIAIENAHQFKALELLNAELNNRVDEQVGEIERMARLKRFLPSAVADAVVSAGDESMLSSHRAMIATLFCDMRGFTAFCEAAEPEETIEVLQTYHQEMGELIDQYGGGVDQRAGDGIMVIFNDPIPVDDPARDAVQLALAMREKMRELCTKWKKLGHRLGFGIGISFGYATVGMVGSSGRFDYTASGTSVNTAARLCDMAENDEILVSPRAWAAIEGIVEAKSRGEVSLKGIREPVEVFAVVAD